MQELAPPTRTCATCGDEKPVSGVWYLLAPALRPVRASPFVCEACYKIQALEPVP